MRTLVKNILFIHLILCSSKDLFGQLTNGIVVYRVSLTAKNKTIANGNINKKIDDNTFNEMKALLEGSKDVRGILKFDRNSSIYQRENVLENDLNKSYNLTIPAAGGDKVFYTNFNKEKFIEQDCKILGSCFLIQNKRTNWVLVNESQQIDGYECFMAELINPDYKDKIIAWYAPEIPIPFGPLNYNGLPGLVLVVESKIATFTVEQIKLNLEDSKIEIIEPKKGRSITKKEFIQMIRESSPFYNDN
jgi:GLPGLI family protein